MSFSSGRRPSQEGTSHHSDVEASASCQTNNVVSGTGSQERNNTIMISSGSGECSQLNVSQLDTQLRLFQDVEEVDEGGGDVQLPASCE